ncbi:MAG: universal stress protein [Chroococcus sp. CMT-3BRIN-NPC107]|jgi:nucleotide-binding universal stress UspA family protein|nr:universal stress protein [Chroococcus sp. CMT-3BRIN-NPC107]
MFAKILVAIDSSTIGKTVFDKALDLAKTTGASMMLLHVLSYEDGMPNLPTSFGREYYTGLNSKALELYQQQYKEFENRGLNLLQSFAAQAIAAGVSAEFSQNRGSPGQTICDLAINWQADLIVMGRRGKSGLNELIMGSVSNYVLHHACCSVLVVQHLANKKLEPQPEQAVISST